MHISNPAHTVAVLYVLEAHGGVGLELKIDVSLEFRYPRIPASTAPTMACRLARAEGLLKRFWARETHAGRVTPPGFPAPPPPATEPSFSAALAIPNPFIPILNPVTRRWRPPRYSRRRQAELVKAARLLQVESILPLGPKGQRKLGGTPPKPVPNSSTLVRKALHQPVTWVGEPPPVNEKGLYGSRRFLFKGHKWERQLPGREQALHDFKVKHDQRRYAPY